MIAVCSGAPEVERERSRRSGVLRDGSALPAVKHLKRNDATMAARDLDVGRPRLDPEQIHGDGGWVKPTSTIIARPGDANRQERAAMRWSACCGVGVRPPCWI
jgi:hypothetical protein